MVVLIRCEVAVRACVRACARVRACMRASERACVRTCVLSCVRLSVRAIQCLQSPGLCLWAWISVASTATRRAIGWHGLGADPADGAVLLILRRGGVAALNAVSDGARPRGSSRKRKGPIGIPCTVARNTCAVMQAGSPAQRGSCQRNEEERPRDPRRGLWDQPARASRLGCSRER